METCLSMVELNSEVMHLFCPTCANLLVVEEGPSCYRFACNTCPYVQNIERKVSEEKQLTLAHACCHASGKDLFAL